MIVSTVTDEQAFRALHEDWNNLVRQSKSSLFLSHEWFEAAWAWRKVDASLYVLLTRRNERVTGILPLVRRQHRSCGLTYRSLEFLTVPDTQFCDVIAAPNTRDEVVATLCAELRKRRNEWDRLHLRYMDDADSSIYKLKTALVGLGHACHVRTHSPNLFVQLDGTWNDYYNARTRSLKKANNLAANRLRKTGEIAITWLSKENSDSNAVQTTLQQVIDISSRSWKKETGNSLDQPGPRSFITTLTNHAVKNGWISIWLLAIDDRALAMEYQLVDNGNVYALRADFDADCEEISPGSHLMRTLLEALFDRGWKRYYMGPGENAYKTRWTDHSDSLMELVAYSGTWRGKILGAAEEELKPALKCLRDEVLDLRSKFSGKKSTDSVKS